MIHCTSSKHHRPFSGISEALKRSDRILALLYSSHSLMTINRDKDPCPDLVSSFQVQPCILSGIDHQNTLPTPSPPHQTSQADSTRSRLFGNTLYPYVSCYRFNPRVTRRLTFSFRVSQILAQLSLSSLLRIMRLRTVSLIESHDCFRPLTNSKATDDRHR